MPKCYSEQDIEDELVKCGSCSRVSADDQCSSKCEVGCTLMNTDTKAKSNIAVSHNILKEVVPPYSLKIAFVKLLLKGPYSPEINT